ncbi:YgjP-like metallopeptidase domain-containing protein [Nitratifractor sp.]
MEAEEYLHYLADGSTLFYTLRRRRGMKNLYLYIREGGLEVRCSPRVSFERIESFLREKESWFLPRLRAPAPKAPDPLDSFPYLGERLPLRLCHDPSLGDRILLRLDEAKKRAELHSATPPSPVDVRELYELFYRKNAPLILAPAVERWSKKMGLSPIRLSHPPLLPPQQKPLGELQQPGHDQPQHPASPPSRRTPRLRDRPRARPPERDEPLSGLLVSGGEGDTRLERTEKEVEGLRGLSEISFNKSLGVLRTLSLGVICGLSPRSLRKTTPQSPAVEAAK